MESSMFAVIFTGICALATLGGTVFTTIRSGKDARDRAADRDVALATAEKLQAERDEITERTTASVLREVRQELRDAKAELAQAKKELKAAYQQVDLQRQELAQKNQTIEDLTEDVRRAMRRAATLEKWIEKNADKIGADGLPPDYRKDRKHEDE